MDQQTEITVSLEDKSKTDQPLRGSERINRNQKILTDKIVLPALFTLSVALGYVGADLAQQYFLPKAALAVEITPLEQTPPSLEIRKISSQLEERVFKNFSPEEKAKIEEEIAKYKANYEKANDKARIDRVLDWEKTTIKPILDLDVDPRDHQFWSKFMSAIAYVESAGKASAKSEIGIVGVAQISEATARETGKRHGIRVFDLNKGWDSLRLSRFHLQDLMESYGTDVSLLGYYGGVGFTDRKIKAALDKSRINIANLGSEDGMEYLSKFIAAARILEKARTTKS